jgi:hypothetical protein
MLRALSAVVSRLILIRLGLVVRDLVDQPWVVFEAWIHRPGLHDPNDRVTKTRE